MPFNERITNHRRLMKAAMYRLTLIENEEHLLKDNPGLLEDRKIKLIGEYGDLMTELTQAILTDGAMKLLAPPNMAELEAQFYKNKLHDKNKGVFSGPLAHR